ncbi:hypothetical protein [Microbacterium sp. BDGP8]|uniref:hypothetical protein n=1 Tax=Microbacterium sp. BDGP8 TaxID=3035531 RepID=UPI00249E2B0E|nr:hypothetical protein [Microbacterium sp. BDGP8]WHE35153.1 hypothetical protein P6897_10640 [Microbacterium sp. BDGP8]
MTLPDRFTRHSAVVRAKRRGGGMGGGGYADPRTVRAWVVDEQQTVIGADAVEVISSTQVSLDIDEDIPQGSLVTVWSGAPNEREAVVLAISVFRHERLPSFQTLHLK